MKRILLFAAIILSLTCKAQFPNTDSLHRFNNKFIRNSAVEAFGQLRLNTLLHGIIEQIDSAKLGIGGAIGMDTAYAINDSTVRYRKNGVSYTFTQKGIYDYRRKVDSLYAFNDSILRIVINGSSRDVLVRGKEIRKINDSSLVVGPDTISLSASGTETIDILSLKRDGKLFTRTPVAKKQSELRSIASADLDTGFIYNLKRDRRNTPYYYDPNDNASVDDSASVIVAGTKRLKLMVTESVNVLDFGAVPDGVTDNAPFINKAIDYAYNKKIGKVYIPKDTGTFIISSAIHLKSGIIIYGDGYDTHLKQGSSWTSVYPNNMGLFNIYQQNNISIRGIRFEGKLIPSPPAYPTDVNTWGKLIYGELSDSIEISDCFFENSNYEGVWQGGNARDCNVWVIKNNKFTKVAAPNSFIGLPALQLNVSNSIVDGNIFSECGIAIGSTGPRHTIINNRIFYPVYYGVQIGDQPVFEDSPQDGLYANNTIYTNSDYYGFLFDQNFNTTNTITGNIVVLESGSTNAAAYRLTGAGTLNFFGNTAIIKNKGNGVTILGSTDTSYYFNVKSSNNEIIKKTSQAGYGFIANAFSNTRKLNIYQSDDRVLCDTPTTATFSDYNYNGVNTTNNKVFLNKIISTGAIGITGPDGNAYAIPNDPYRMGKPGQPITLSNQGVTETNIAMTVGKFVLDESANISISGNQLNITASAGYNRTKSYIKILPEVIFSPDSVGTISGVEDRGYLMIIHGSTTYSNYINIRFLSDAGNIRLANGQDFLMDDPSDNLTLIFDGEYWNEVARSIDIVSIDPGTENIYNSDGQMEGDRQVDGNDKSLEFGYSGNNFRRIRAVGDSVEIASQDRLLLSGPLVYGSAYGSGEGDVAVPNTNIITLAPLSANRTLYLDYAQALENGRVVKIANRNTSDTYHWTFAETVTDLAGNVIPLVPNACLTEVMYRDGQWWLHNQDTTGMSIGSITVENDLSSGSTINPPSVAAVSAGIESAVIAGGTTLSKWVNAVALGLVSDATGPTSGTNNSPRLQAIYDSLPSNTTIYLGGNFRFVKPIVWSNNNKKIHIWQEGDIYSGDSTFIIVDSRFNEMNFRGSISGRNVTTASNLTGLTNAGIWVRHGQNNRISANYIGGYKDAIRMGGSAGAPTVGNGAQYNTVSWLRLYRCTNGIHFNVAGTWANSNFFNGGHISCLYGVRFTKGADQIDPYNKNIFRDIGFEYDGFGGEMLVGIVAEHCLANYFGFGGRYEGVNGVDKKTMIDGTCTGFQFDGYDFLDTDLQNMGNNVLINGMIYSAYDTRVIGTRAEGYSPITGSSQNGRIRVYGMRRIDAAASSVPANVDVVWEKDTWKFSSAGTYATPYGVDLVISNNAGSNTVTTSSVLLDEEITITNIHSTGSVTSNGITITGPNTGMKFRNCNGTMRLIGKW